MKDKQKAIYCLMIWGLVTFFVGAGCGIKGLPLPPEIKGQMLAVPFDLKGIPSGNEMILSWRHEIDKETAALVPEGFEVFGAKKSIASCSGCPFEFQQIGSVAMPAMTFSTKIEKGFKYYFRVQAFITKDNIRSEDSNLFQFESK